MESNFSNADAVAVLSSDKPQAFRALINHYQHPLFGFLGRMGLSQSDAEDVAQDVFLKAWQARTSYRASKAQVVTWLFAIARNTTIDHLKNAKHKQIRLQEVELQAAPEHQPEQVFQRQGQIQQLSIAIKKLPLDDRCAIALFYIDELSIAEAASILNCKPNAFKTRLSRARKKLGLIITELEDTK